MTRLFVLLIILIPFGVNANDRQTSSGSATKECGSVVDCMDAMVLLANGLIEKNLELQNTIEELKEEIQEIKNAINGRVAYGDEVKMGRFVTKDGKKQWLWLVCGDSNKSDDCVWINADKDGRRESHYTINKN